MLTEPVVRRHHTGGVVRKAATRDGMLNLQRSDVRAGQVSEVNGGGRLGISGSGASSGRWPAPEPHGALGMIEKNASASPLLFRSR